MSSELAVKSEPFKQETDDEAESSNDGRNLKTKIENESHPRKSNESESESSEHDKKYKQPRKKQRSFRAKFPTHSRVKPILTIDNVDDFDNGENVWIRWDSNIGETVQVHKSRIANLEATLHTTKYMLGVILLIHIMRCTYSHMLDFSFDAS